MDFRRLIIVSLMDLLLLASLTIAIWWAHFDPAAIAWRFCQVFLPCALLTVLAARVVLKRFAPKREDAGRGFGPVGLFGRIPDKD
ncbi:MAG: hypothetical protein HY812_03415 [Planctomycetes bacterium]|nr:hypothetical protein [Planctomycetota bacterium]